MMYLLAVVLPFAASLASAAEFTVLYPQRSSVTFVSKQMGVPVEGSFRKFTARITFDPARPKAGSAHIDIDLAGIDTGNAEADAEVAGSKWFDVRNHPRASFVSGSIVQTGKGRYQASGKLSIKGKTLDVSAPFTLRQDAGMLVIDGMFPIKRLDYGIGTGIWSDTDTVADEVQIRFHFTLATKSLSQQVSYHALGLGVDGCKAQRAANGCSIGKRCNTADAAPRPHPKGRLPAGALRCCGVAACLWRMTTLRSPRLALHPAGKRREV